MWLGKKNDMGYWDIDYDGLVRQNVPVRLRKGVMLAWLGVLVSPVRAMYGVWKASRAANLYVLAHNGQVCYLEAALNDTFDMVNRGLYIVDADEVDPEYWALDAEDAPVWWGLDSEADPDYWPLDSEVTGTGAFVVHVPGTVTFDMARLVPLVNYYKLPGTTYTVVID
jgi:hypothetical protein